MLLRLLNWLDNAKQRWEKNFKQQRNNVYLSSFNFSHNGWLFPKCIWAGCKLFPGSSQPMNKTVTGVVISLMLSNTAFWFWQHVLKYNKTKTFTLQSNTVRKNMSFWYEFFPMIQIPLQTYKARVKYVFVKSYHSLVFDNLVFVQNLRCICCRFADRTICGKVISLCTHWLYHWLIRHHILVDALQNRAKIQ